MRGSGSKVFLAIALGASLAACLSKQPDGMTTIPAGDFVMGSDDVALEEEARALGITKPWVLDATPAHPVNLPAYFIDRLEVTNAEYFLFAAATGAPALPHWKYDRPTPEQERLPVFYVSWFESDAYCRWAGKRLPTEAEWEKAARGGNGTLYPWGDAFSRDRANVGGLYANLFAVGSFPKGRSPQGVMDLIGNVWEWTADWYQAYPESEYSSDAYGERFRVVRGNSLGGLGHFESEELDTVVAAEARAAYRLYFPPNAALEDVGFRCVRDIQS